MEPIVIHLHVHVHTGEADDRETAARIRAAAGRLDEMGAEVPVPGCHIGPQGEAEPKENPTHGT